MKGGVRAAAFVCWNCGRRVAARDSFCAACGSDLRNPTSVVPAHLQQRIRNARVALEAERKFVTILFADVVESTALIDDLDPEQAAMLLDPALQSMVAAVRRHGGIITRILGDGIMALFGAPVAQEDHAARASRAALDIRSLSDDPKLQVRIGLHSGEVALRTVRSNNVVEYDATGVNVHLAARMEQTAAPGTIRVTAATQRLIAGQFDCLSLGWITVKRAAGRDVETFELCRALDWQDSWRARASRSLGAFVGRISELEKLEEAARRVLEGRAQVAAIVGHAGTGKSRLAHEFAATKIRSGWQVLEVTPGAEARYASYLPFARMLRDWCGAGPDDPHEEVLQRIRGALSELRLDDATLLPPLAALLDAPSPTPDWSKLPPATRRRRCAEAIVLLLRRLGRDRTLLLLIEDAHALDAESQVLLDSMIDHLTDIAALVIVTYRPDYHEEWQRTGEYRLIELRRLDDADCGLLLDARLGRDPGLASIKAQLAARTQGIPLFVEEMIRNLCDTGVLLGEPGRYRLKAPAGHLEIPDTVQSVLAARVDRLPLRRKRVLQVAAAVGGEFSLALLTHIFRRPAAQLAADLASLREAEFIVARDGKADSRLAFRHVLVEEVTYRSLLTPRRRDIHRSIAGAMEQLYADRMAQYAEQIAWHAINGELWDRAVVHSRQAALKAIDRATHPSAIHFIEQALTALARSSMPPREASEQEIELRLLLRVSLGALGHYDQWATNLDTAARLAQDSGDMRRLLAVRIAQLHVLNAQGEMTAAIAACRHAENMARAQKDSEHIVAATYFLGQALNWHGAFADANTALEKVRPVLDSLPPHSRCGMTGTAQLMCDSQRAACHAALGEFATAFAYGRAAMRGAALTKRDFDLAVASFGYGTALAMKGAIRRAVQVLEAGLAATETSDSPLLFVSIAGPLGYVRLLNGDKVGALSLTERLIGRPEVSSYSRAWSLLYRALVCLGTGPGHEAPELINDALSRARKNGYRAVEATATMLLGRAARRADPLAALRHLEAAASQAEALGCRAVVAHCHTEMAFAAAATGRSEDASRLRREAARRYHELGMRFWLLRLHREWYGHAPATSVTTALKSRWGDQHDGTGAQERIPGAKLA